MTKSKANIFIWVRRIYSFDEDVLKTSWRPLLKMKTKDIFKASSRRFHQDECLLGSFCNYLSLVCHILSRFLNKPWTFFTSLSLFVTFLPKFVTLFNKFLIFFHLFITFRHSFPPTCEFFSLVCLFFWLCFTSLLHFITIFHKFVSFLL